MGNWSSIVRWVEDTREAGVLALANLERTEAVTVGMLRAALASLQTAEARRAILPTMASPGARVRDVVKAAAAAKTMWVGFHWLHPENPFIRAELRVFLPPAAGGSCGTGVGRRHGVRAAGGAFRVGDPVLVKKHRPNRQDKYRAGDFPGQFFVRVNVF